MTTTASGLQYDVTQAGDGENFPKKGDVVHVHYTGTLSTGSQFDSSYDRGEPISFKLGVGQVIKGWDEGIALMSIGEKGVLTIPPELGYGKQNVGGGLIPANSTLVFEVELVGIN